MSTNYDDSCETVRELTNEIDCVKLWNESRDHAKSLTDFIVSRDWTPSNTIAAIIMNIICMTNNASGEYLKSEKICEFIKAFCSIRDNHLAIKKDT